MVWRWVVASQRGSNNWSDLLLLGSRHKDMTIDDTKEKIQMVCSVLMTTYLPGNEKRRMKVLSSVL